MKPLFNILFYQWSATLLGETYVGEQICFAFSSLPRYPKSETDPKIEKHRLEKVLRVMKMLSENR